MIENYYSVQAEYTEQVVPEYKGLPLIEALPPILSMDDAEEILHYYPPFEKSEKEFDDEVRKHCIERVFEYNQPWDRHIDLEQRISRMIRRSYANRFPFNPDNPLAPGHALRINAIYEGLKHKSYESINVPALRASGMTIIGISGGGKTRSTESILGIYPPMIIHSTYNGKKFEHRQVVWIKIDCSSHGSLKALCQDFLKEYDKITGENTFNRFGDGTAETISLQMGRIAEVCTLGLFVIDEIQNLSTAKSGGQEVVLNFFDNLRNRIGVPVILIGTPKARSILQCDFRHARRGSGQQGDMFWSNIDKNDKDTWSLVLGGIWHYQWTKNYCELTQNLSDAIYDESQGIIDIAIKLFAMAQVRAINTGEEIITEEIIRTIAHEQLRLVQPMLDALRSGDVEKLNQFPDMQPIIWENFLAEENRKYPQKRDQVNPLSTPIVTNNKPERTSKKKLRMSNKALDNNHIPNVVKNGINDGLDAYGSLKDAGIIVDIGKDL